MSEGPSIDDYSAEFWRRAKVASNVLHLARLVRPQDEEVGTLYRYRLFELDGAECGEAHYAVLIEPGKIIWTGDGRKLRVVDVVPVVEDDSSFVGFLRVEPTKKTTVETRALAAERASSHSPFAGSSTPALADRRPYAPSPPTGGRQIPRASS